MIAMFVIVYCLTVWLLFTKLKLVKVSPISIAAAVVVGVVVIGAIVILWSFAAPNTKQLVVSRYAVQIVPQVAGQVKKIHAEPLQPIKKGEVLFEIVPDPFQYSVDQLSAQREAARQNVERAAAGLNIAKADLAQAEAQREAAQTALEISDATSKLNENAISRLKVVQLEQQFIATEAGVDRAKAQIIEATFGLQAAKDTVKSVEAQLADARFKLECCTVRAPADGFVVNWQVRQGTMTATLPFAAVGTFVETANVELVASFGQNVVTFVRPDDPVEIALRSQPGRIVTGKVAAVIPTTGEGQFVTSGSLISAADITSDGMFAVKITLDDPQAVKDLEMGTAGMVAIYTDHFQPFHIISKVVVRMNAWQNYLFPM